MKKVVVGLVVTSLAFGCSAVAPQQRNVASLLIVMNAIETSKLALAYAKLNAVENGKTNTCIASGIAISAMNSASSTIINGLSVIPAVTVDVSDCIGSAALNPKTSTARDEALAALVGTFTRSVLGTAEYYFISTQVSAQDPATCKDAAIALGIIRYLEPIPAMVVTKLRNFDGKISIPSVVIPEPAC